MQCNACMHDIEIWFGLGWVWLWIWVFGLLGLGLVWVWRRFFMSKSSTFVKVSMRKELHFPSF